MKAKLVQFIGRAQRANTPFAYLLAMALAVFLTPVVHAQTTTPSSLMSVDSSGNVSFTPSVLTLELLGVVGAAISAGAGLYFAWVGIRWIYRIVKGSK